MKQLILTQFPWTWLPTLSLVIFFFFFVGVIIVTSRRAARNLHQVASLLPLEEAAVEEGKRHE